MCSSKVKYLKMKIFNVFTGEANIIDWDLVMVLSEASNPLKVCASEGGVHRRTVC